MSWQTLFKEEYPKEEPPVPRMQTLQNLVGKYTTLPYVDISKIHPIIKGLLDLNKINAEEAFLSGIIGRKKIGKWLKDAHFPDDMISRTISEAVRPPFDFEITVDFKDILRMSKSKHYTSCLNTKGNLAIYEYLRNPSMGLIVARGPTGDFSFRAIINVGLIRGSMQECLIICNGRSYGVSPGFDFIGAALEKTNLPIFVSPFGTMNSLSSSTVIFPALEPDINGWQGPFYSEMLVRINDFKKEYQSKITIDGYALNASAKVYADAEKFAVPV